MRNGARSSKLFKQIAWSNCASLHLFTSSQSLAFASISKPPPPPSPHNGPIESVHLSSITCLKPHLPLYSLFSSLPFVFFFLPFSPSTPTHTSHTTRFKGNSSRSDGGGGCWRGDRLSERRSAWSLQGDAREDIAVGIKYGSILNSHTHARHGHTLNSFLPRSHSHGPQKERIGFLCVLRGRWSQL